MHILIINLHRHTHLGGAEIQSDILATQWARLGHRVTYAALDTTAAALEGLETEYEVLAAPDRNTRTLFALLEQTKPDIVYWRAGRGGLLRAATLARLSEARFVFAIVHATHVLKSSYNLTPSTLGAAAFVKSQILKARALGRSRLNYEAYRLADGIVSNTQHLLPLAPTGPGYTHVRAAIYNAMQPVCDGSFEWPRPYVLWVANLGQRKNPEKYVEVARALQDLELDFLMIGRIVQPQYAWIQDPSKVPRNFRFLGPRSPEQVNSVLAGARMLVHTCDPEGFPGNFIQAWWQAQPTLTLHYDPDGVIEANGIGRRSGSVDQLVEDVRELATNAKLRDEMGQRALEFAQRSFDPATNARRYIEFFERVLRER